MTTMVENKDTMILKSLTEWWSEETAYIFQRIEKWTGSGLRGYNRLQSQRWLRNRLMQESWSLFSEEISQFCPLKRSRWKLHPEEIKINYYGTFNYQSNSTLNSNCLETYQYDHSIYFQTIGDIRSNKKKEHQNQDDTSIDSEEQVK